MGENLLLLISGAALGFGLGWWMTDTMKERVWQGLSMVTGEPRLALFMVKHPPSTRVEATSSNTEFVHGLWTQVFRIDMN
jgi:hypothetical protein